MSSTTFKNLIQRRAHAERSQPAARERLGLLEKKKDWLARAKNFGEKKARLRALERRATMRNPDEFYHGMLSAGPAPTRGAAGEATRARPVDQKAQKI